MTTAVKVLFLLTVMSGTATGHYWRYNWWWPRPPRDDPQTRPVVEINDLGSVRGVREKVKGVWVDKFLGIPFAEQERWMPATPVWPWKGVRDASKFGKVCPHSRCMVPHEESEDCLNLDVYRPTGTRAHSKIPVMLWVLASGYQLGCTNSVRGERLAAQGVMVVVFNYRLNVFGFLGSERLRERHSNSTGNFGIEDQRAAMRWVQDHIGSFGGDPNEVTIFGESGGGGSVSVHLSAVERSKGLFKRALVQSAMGTLVAKPMRSAEEWFERVLKDTGCADVCCLKGKTTKELVDAIKDYPLLGTDGLFSFSPVIDGVWLTDTPDRLIAAGQYQRGVSLMTGVVREEIALFYYATPNWGEADFDRLVGRFVRGPADLVTLKKLYREDRYEYPANRGQFSTWWWKIASSISDARKYCTARAGLRALSSDPSNHVAHYFYAIFRPLQSRTDAALTGPGTVTAHHGTDVPYVFNCAGFNEGGDCAFDVRSEQLLSDEISRLVVDFGKGKSSLRTSTGLPWLPYRSDYENLLTMDVPRNEGGKGFGNIFQFRDEQCDFWDSLGSLNPNV